MSLKSLIVGTVAALALGGCAPSAAPETPVPGESVSDAYVYVPNQDAATISVVDRATGEEVDRIDLQALGFSANAKPHHIVVESDGEHWYVSLIGENRVLKLDRENRVVAQAEFDVPGLMALHPGGRFLLVGRSMSAVNPPQSVGVIDRTTMEVEEEVEVLYPRPHALAVRPQGDIAYSGSLGVNQIAAIDVESGDVELTRLEGPTHTLVQYAVSPDGQTLVATTQLTGKLLVFDLTDPMHPRLVRSIDVPAQPWHPVFAPDGRTVWFANKAANAVTGVDLEAGNVRTVVTGAGIERPHGAAISPDGRWLYISSQNRPGKPGSLVVIDTEAGQIERVVPLDVGAAGIGVAAG